MLFKHNLSGLLLLLLLVPNLSGNSTEGTPYITNIKYPDNQQNFVWSIAQTFQGTMLIAGKTGLLEFDSESWSSIEIPDVAFMLKASEFQPKIFISGRNFIGYLSKNKEGLLSYNSLVPDSLSIGNFKDIIETKSCIYFYSTRSIICIERSTNQIKKTWNASDNLYLGIFSTGASVYLNVVNEGLYEIQDTKLVSVNSNEILNKSIIFCAKYADNISLIGTDNGDLFLFDRKVFTSYKIDDKEFLSAGILSDGVLMDENTLALSTINFGVLKVDKHTGKTLNIINYNSGLPNDYITNLFADDEHGLWMAHPLGLSRIDYRLPMTNFGSYTGLGSNVITINYWNNKLYTATSTGVFSLDTINRYTSKEVIKRIPVNSNPVKRSQTILKKEDNAGNSDKTPVEADNNSEEKDSEKKDKKGFFKKLFSKDETEEIKKDKTTQKRNKNETEIFEPVKIDESAQKFEYLSYNQYTLKTKDFGFEQLPEIDKRCKLLIPIAEQLIAVTDAKVYSIDKKDNVNEIFKTTHIYTALKSKYHPNLVYVVTEDGIYQGIFNNTKCEFKLSVENKGHFNMTDAIELDGGNLLVAHDDEILFYSLKNDTTSILNVYNPYSESVTFKSVNDKKYMLIGNALYLINYKEKKVSFEKLQEINIVNSFLTQNDNLWIKSENSGFKYFGNTQIPEKVFSFLKAFDNITDIQIDNNGNLWMVENYENIYQLNTSDFEKYKINADVIIKEIRTQSGGYLPWKNAKLKYSDNALTFVVVSPSYLKLNSNQYQYLIEGLMENWSDWSSENIISVPFLPPGDFKFKVRAKNLFGEISEIESYSFRIIPPFWRTPYFYIICAIFIIIGFHFWQKYKMFKHIKEKEILQQKVKERTVELELKNKAITDSIVYAERMQRGILPADDILTSSLSEHFVLYMPKNIVSGDFYWLSQKEKITYVVAADCTGHGVPGAFMSMLGVAYLNEIIRSLPSSNTTAAEILENLRERIIKLFSQETFITNDGIDIALLVIDPTNKKIQYAGAYNPLYQITSNKNTSIDKEKIEGVNDQNILAVYKADKFHVGKAARNFRKFTNHIIPYNEDDTFYIFSDGFVDQFGGAEESKFMYGPFRKLILEISEKPMEIQKKELLTRFNEWKGEIEQTDDILILGLKP